MNKERSIKEIEKLSTEDRWLLARENLSDSENEGAVPALLDHIRAHENTRWLVYSSIMTEQIPRSYAAHAYFELQKSVLHYEIMRLCTFWDPVDLDSRSIPTIAALADCSGVSECVYCDHLSHYQSVEHGIAKKLGTKARRDLRTGIRGSHEIEGSDVLRHVRNFRDKLAHQLEKTRREKNSAVPLPRYGDERKLLGKTITTVNRLYLSLSGTGFDWDSAKKMHKRNAEALWKGVTISVLR